MVGVAQLVERWFVVPDVTGPSPVTHPCFSSDLLTWFASQEATAARLGRIQRRILIRKVGHCGRPFSLWPPVAGYAIFYPPSWFALPESTYM